MAYRLFHDLFPAVAEQETRTLTILPGARSDCRRAISGFWKCFVMSRAVIVGGSSSPWSRLPDKRSKRSWRGDGKNRVLCGLDER